MILYNVLNLDASVVGVIELNDSSNNFEKAINNRMKWGLEYNLSRMKV
jgi:hypothetical protein